MGVVLEDTLVLYFFSHFKVFKINKKRLYPFEMNSYLRETCILHCSQLPCEQSEPGTTHIYRQDTGWNRWVHVLHCNWKRGRNVKANYIRKVDYTVL